LVLVVGATVYRAAPLEAMGVTARPTVMVAIYSAWMALLSQPVFTPPRAWYLALMQAVYPLLGFILFGEGIVRLAMLLMSRRHGEKEWMRVMAATYRDHVVLCGVGHLGYRVLQQLLAGNVPVVAIEKEEDGRFVATVKQLGVPVLIRDMKDDQALIDAGIRHARCVIIATNDDMANLEVALDARRMNPSIRVIMRLFDQQIATKIAGAFHIDMAFSASALAAPIVAAMSMETRVLCSHLIGQTSHVVAEMTVTPGSSLIGCSAAELVRTYGAHILAHTHADDGSRSAVENGGIGAGDKLVVHVPTWQLAALSAQARDSLVA
jgi:voltage-gated potassium channel Kch